MDNEVYDGHDLTEEEKEELEDEYYKDINKEMLTCFSCKYAGTCQYAYDPYNTDGDCLASK